MNISIPKVRVFQPNKERILKVYIKFRYFNKCSNIINRNINELLNKSNCYVFITNYTLIYFPVLTFSHNADIVMFVQIYRD